MNITSLPLPRPRVENLFESLKSHRASVAVIGLGHVGLPLAAMLGRRFQTLGFDVDHDRIQELADGTDRSGEVTRVALAQAAHMSCSHVEKDLQAARVYIVTVPTPIDASRRPDLTCLQTASRLIGRHLAPGDVVIFESTVYPGCTEEECVPVLEEASGLLCHGLHAREPEPDQGFFVGYSPERVNRGDAEHTLLDVVKVTSGSTPAAADFIDRLYASIVPAASSKLLLRANRAQARSRWPRKRCWISTRRRSARII